MLPNASVKHLARDDERFQLQPTVMAL